LIERLEISDHSKTTTNSALFGEPVKISRYDRDKIAMMGISPRQLCGIQIQDIARPGSGLRQEVAWTDRSWLSSTPLA
jgi:hypothetical protein